MKNFDINKSNNYNRLVLNSAIISVYNAYGYHLYLQRLMLPESYLEAEKIADEVNAHNINQDNNKQYTAEDIIASNENIGYLQDEIKYAKAILQNKIEEVVDRYAIDRNALEKYLQNSFGQDKGNNKTNEKINSLEGQFAIEMEQWCNACLAFFDNAINKKKLITALTSNNIPNGKKRYNLDDILFLSTTFVYPYYRYDEEYDNRMDEKFNFKILIPEHEIERLIADPEVEEESWALTPEEEENADHIIVLAYHLIDLAYLNSHIQCSIKLQDRPPIAYEAAEAEVDRINTMIETVNANHEKITTADYYPSTKEKQEQKKQLQENQIKFDQMITKLVNDFALSEDKLIQYCKDHLDEDGRIDIMLNMINFSNWSDAYLSFYRKKIDNKTLMEKLRGISEYGPIKASVKDVHDLAIEYLNDYIALDPNYLARLKKEKGIAIKIDPEFF